MKNGTVKEYDPGKGFGFIIAEDGEEYFVHVSELRPPLHKVGLREGEQVVFDVDYDHKGDRAINVRKA
ncbi:MAG: cold-shock protein [Fidelibacterota bacterium]